MSFSKCQQCCGKTVSLMQNSLKGICQKEVKSLNYVLWPNSCTSKNASHENYWMCAKLYVQILFIIALIHLIIWTNRELIQRLYIHTENWDFPSGSAVKNPTAMQETWVWSLSWGVHYFNIFTGRMVFSPRLQIHCCFSCLNTIQSGKQQDSEL